MFLHHASQLATIFWSEVGHHGVSSCHHALSRKQQQRIGFAIRSPQVVFNRFSVCGPALTSSLAGYFIFRERRTLIFIAGIVPLLISDLRPDWADVIGCADASPQSFGTCQRRCTPGMAWPMDGSSDEDSFSFQLQNGSREPVQNCGVLSVMSERSWVVH